MTVRLSSWSLVLLLSAFPAQLPAQEVLEQFPIFGDGDGLLVPVKIRDKRYFFVVDTGSSRSVVDSSLPVGEERGFERIATPHRVMIAKKHSLPQLRLGKRDFDLEVWQTDLTMIRKVSGHDISGIIGLDVLKRYVVQLDFDGQTLRLQTSLGANLGFPVKLTYKDTWYWAPATLSGVDGSHEFIIDSGFISPFGTGSLSRTTLDALSQRNRVKVVQTSKAATFSGIETTSSWRIESLRLGGFEHKSAILGTSQRNFLNLNHLSRFNVTFDFPNKTMYLKKSKRFAHPDLYDLSGLHILREKGSTFVESADKDSVAEKAGIEANDDIVSVNGKKAKEYRMFTLRQLLATEGSVSLVTQRGITQRRVQLVLARRR